MVSALRNLARIGDERVDRITITPNSCFAWLIMFVEWCLGITPAIYMSSGTVVNPEPESKVTIVLPISPTLSNGITVETFTTSGSLFDTIRIQHAVDEYGKTITFVGMVSIRTHAEQILMSMNAHQGLGLSTIMQALSYAIPEASSRLIPFSNRSQLEVGRTRERSKLTASKNCPQALAVS